MAMTRESLVLGINNAKIAELTMDDSTELTYDKFVNVPGITALSLTPEFDEKELRGDEKVLDHRTKLIAIEWSFENVMLSLDALAILEGGTVTTDGATPDETYTYSVTDRDLPKYFKLQAKSDYTEVGDIHIVLYKCKANEVEVTLEGEEYATVSASGKAIGTVNNGKVRDIIFNETAKEITDEPAI